MSRTHYTLKEHIALIDALRAGPLAHSHHRLFKVCRDFWSLLHNTPYAFAILAEQLDDSAVDDLGGAFERLADQVEAMRTAISDVMTATDRACSEERRRLKDHVAFASHRQIEIVGERNRLERLLERGASEDVLQKRERMRGAGVPESELDRLAPLLDQDALRGQIDALDAESAMLGQFIRTADESILPADFAARARAHRDLQESMRSARFPNLAVMGP